MSTLKVGEIKHESFTGTTQLKLDSAGRLLVGSDTEGHENADDLTIAGSGQTGITIRSGTTSGGNIYFSDATSGNAEFDGFIAYSQNTNRMQFGTNQNTRMTIDSSGNVGIGVIPKSGQYSGYNHLQVGESATLSSNDTQSDTNVTNLAQNVYLNSNASAWKYLHTDEASKYEQAGGVHSFQVAPSGSADATISFSNILRIDSDGIKFNGDTAAANALDDYEEGTFTPSIFYQNSSGLTISTNSAGGKYTKIGRIVWVIGAINWTVSGSPVNDNIAILSLPFATNTGAVGTNDTRFAGANITLQNTSDQSNVYMAGAYGNNGINLMVQQDQGNRANEIGGNSGMIAMFQFWYHTA